ncbi:unnamed protein product [Paramecium octaurelia]|uniref:Uncharacterized protein n=1 Tax=Paramecium octaurelia TaxID=43137 RepID=A0A8S1WQF8_PAROT|nr:unnamed protein product [Paramecium octaurelia]
MLQNKDCIQINKIFDMVIPTTIKINPIVRSIIVPHLIRFNAEELIGLINKNRQEQQIVGVKIIICQQSIRMTNTNITFYKLQSIDANQRNEQELSAFDWILKILFVIQRSKSVINGKRTQIYQIDYRIYSFQGM